MDKHATVSDIKIGDRVSYGGEGTGHGEANDGPQPGCLHSGRSTVPARLLCHTRQHCDELGADLGSTDRRVRGSYRFRLVGQLIAQLATAQGARVIATDLRQGGVELARRLGAERALTGGAGFLDNVMSITNGRGVDCVS